MQFGLESNPSVPLCSYVREYDFSPAPLPQRKELLHWARITNPVVGTCRGCGERDLVNRPVIGLYTNLPCVRVGKPASFSMLNSCDATPPVGMYCSAPKPVRSWVPVVNPVIGTCRHCGYRGLVDRPVIGCY
jgi:hypothetical protein